MSDIENKNSPYTVNRTIKEIVTGPSDRPTGKVSVIVQQRLRDDGNMSREFVSLKCEVKKKVIFFSVMDASDLVKGLEQALPEAVSEDRRMRAEWEERRNRSYSGEYDSVTGEISVPEVLVQDEEATKRAEKIERDKKEQIEAE